jgi:hemerythrin
MIQWSEEYATGIEDIDKQHQALFKFFGVLEEKINKGDVTIVENSVGFMKTYLSEHFQFEEMCMFGVNCPEAERNMEAHKQFVVKLNEFDEKVKGSDDPLSVLKEMNQYVEFWLVNHIRKVDTELKKCWRANSMVKDNLEGDLVAS